VAADELIQHQMTAEERDATSALEVGRRIGALRQRRFHTFWMGSRPLGH